MRPAAQRIVEAAPAAAVRGLQAEVGQRGDRIGRQQGIAQLEQGIGAAIEAAMQGGAEGAQGREVMSGHAAAACQKARRRPPGDSLRLGLNHKLRARCKTPIDGSAAPR